MISKNLRRTAPWLPQTAALGLLVFVGGLGLSLPAKADELGNLKHENAVLKEQVDQLAAEMKNLKAAIEENNNTVIQALGKKADIGKTPPKTVSSGNENVGLTLSGQVDRMMLYGEDGHKAQIFSADNKVSTTRLNTTGKAKLDDDLIAGATIEVEIKSNGSDQVTIGQEASTNTSNFLSERKMEVFVDSKQFGKLSLGQGAQATDGITEIDLSGTTVIANSSHGQDVGKSFLFRKSGTNTSSGTTVGALFSNFDATRDDRIRYDTPNFAGFTLNTSYTDGDLWDAGLWYGKKFEAVEVAAGVGYFHLPNKASTLNGFDNVNASGSIKASFGTSLTLAYAQEDFNALNREKATMWYGKLGQDVEWLELGKTSFSIDYAKTHDQNANKTEGSWWNLATVQAISKAATELFFSFGQYNADIPTIDTDRITVAALGARVKF